MRSLGSITFLLLFSSTNATASKFNTSSGKVVKAQKPYGVSVPQRLLSQKKYSQFLDFNHPEFWKEGNHKPDAALEELMRAVLANRADKNELAEVWLLRNEIKARSMELALPLIEKANVKLVRAKLKKDRYDLVLPNFKLPKAKITKKQLKEFEFFFLFSPKCSFCKGLAKNLKGLNNVIPLQVPKGNLHHWKGLPKSDRATHDTINTYTPDKRVPILVIHDKKSGLVNIQRGLQSKSQILSGASTLLARRKR